MLYNRTKLNLTHLITQYTHKRITLKCYKLTVLLNLDKDLMQYHEETSTAKNEKRQFKIISKNGKQLYIIYIYIYIHICIDLQRFTQKKINVT